MYISLQYVSLAVAVAARIAEIVFCEYARPGLPLHLHAAKTAVMFKWQGEGALAERRACEDLEQSSGGIPSDNRGVQCILPIAKKNTSMLDRGLEAMQRTTPMT